MTAPPTGCIPVGGVTLACLILPTVSNIQCANLLYLFRGDFLNKGTSRKIVIFFAGQQSSDDLRIFSLLQCSLDLFRISRTCASDSVYHQLNLAIDNDCRRLGIVSAISTFIFIQELLATGYIGVKADLGICIPSANFCALDQIDEV